jgi:hypothetical protein
MYACLSFEKLPETIINVSFEKFSLKSPFECEIDNFYMEGETLLKSILSTIVPSS